MEVAQRSKGEHWRLFKSIGRGLALGIVAGLLSGLASALFLNWLYWATRTREATPQLLWALPLGGLFIGVIYHHFGGLANLGNNVILEEIYEPRRKVPLRMAPLVLVGTIATHLFGGSAGREGTGIQMAGSLVDTAARMLRLSSDNRRTVLIAGIAGGFASVFGTPLAGAVFAVEVLRVGRPSYRALFPAFIAALVGDQTSALFVEHKQYVVGSIPDFSFGLAGKLLVAGLAFGIAALLFTELTHGMKALFARIIAYPPLRGLAGGAVVVVLTLLVGTMDYNGLGIPLIADAVEGKSIFPGAFFLKTVFTSITIGSGFQGGEVTPLFFVGATLGNALGQIIDVSPGFLAALGFVAVFAGAANAPIACVLMGIELFGADIGTYLALTCVTSYVFSGHRGIYTSQRMDVPKSDLIHVSKGASLRDQRPTEPTTMEQPSSEEGE